jgi:hypothetical protein
MAQKCALLNAGTANSLALFDCFVQSLLQIRIRRWYQAGGRPRRNVRPPLRVLPRSDVSCSVPAVCAAHACSTCSCVNVGCVPKKLMFEAAHVMERCCATCILFHHTHCPPSPTRHSLPTRIHGNSSTAAGFGIDVEGVSFDWARLKQARDRHTRGFLPLLPSTLFSAFTVYAEINESFQNWGSTREPVPNFTHITGFARFVDGHTVEVLATLPDASSSPARTLLATAPHILIATGGFPTPCSLPGGNMVISSDGFFDLECALHLHSNMPSET